MDDGDLIPPIPASVWKRMRAKDSERWAFRYFMLACAFGLGGLLAGSTGRFLPMACTGAYGIALLIERKRQHWVLSESVRDSPYFLGFVLTQTTLAVIFWHYGSAAFESTRGLSWLIGEVSLALLCSVVGLLARHALTALDPTTARHRLSMDQLEADIEKNIQAYHQAQTSFASLVESMLKDRVESQKAEQEDRKKRVQAEADFSRTFSETLAVLTENVNQGLNLLGAQMSKTMAVMADIEATVASNIKTASASIPGLAQKLAEQDGVVADGVAALGDSFQAFAKQMARLAGGLPVEKTIAQLNEAVGKVRTCIEAIDKNLGLPDFRAALQSSAKAVTDFGATNTTVSRSMLALADDPKVKNLKNELQAIDDLLTLFVSTVNKTISSLQPETHQPGKREKRQ